MLIRKCSKVTAMLLTTSIVISGCGNKTEVQETWETDETKVTIPFSELEPSVSETTVLTPNELDSHDYITFAQDMPVYDGGVNTVGVYHAYYEINQADRYNEISGTGWSPTRFLPECYFMNCYLENDLGNYVEINLDNLEESVMSSLEFCPIDEIGQLPWEDCAQSCIHFTLHYSGYSEFLENNLHSSHEGEPTEFYIVTQAIDGLPIVTKFEYPYTEVFYYPDVLECSFGSLLPSITVDCENNVINYLSGTFSQLNPVISNQPVKPWGDIIDSVYEYIDFVSNQLQNDGVTVYGARLMYMPLVEYSLENMSSVNFNSSDNYVDGSPEIIEGMVYLVPVWTFYYSSYYEDEITFLTGFINAITGEPLLNPELTVNDPIWGGA